MRSRSRCSSWAWLASAAIIITPTASNPAIENRRRTIVITSCWFVPFPGTPFPPPARPTFPGSPTTHGGFSKNPRRPRGEELDPSSIWKEKSDCKDYSDSSARQEVARKTVCGELVRVRTTSASPLHHSLLLTTIDSMINIAPSILAADFVRLCVQDLDA